MAASDSENESDFASAESDTEGLVPQGTAKEVVSTSTVFEADKIDSSNTSTHDEDGYIENPPTNDDTVENLEVEGVQLPPTDESPPPSDSPSDAIETETKPITDTATDAPLKTSSILKQTDSDSSDTSSSILKAASVRAGVGGEGSSSGNGAGGWGGWGGWGGSLWSSVSSVAESAQAIGQKVTAVIASVEDSLGVPSPQVMARDGSEGSGLDQETCRLADDMKEHDVSPDIVNEEPHFQDDPPDETTENSQPPRELESMEHEKHEESNLGAVSGFLSGFAAAVQNTGQGLVSGGLDALETLGKKTMEVLSEGDPGLAKKRAMLGVGPSPTLSQLLTEAKAEGAAQADRMGDSSPVPLSYSGLFDEYHGVGHLEALELLSKECAGKVHSMCGGFTGDKLESFQEKLEKLSEAFALDEDQDNLDDDSSKLDEINELFSDITLPLKVDKLAKVSNSWREKVESGCRKESEEEGGVNGGSDGKVQQREEPDKAREEETSEEGAKSPSDKKATSEVLYENGLRSLAELTSTAIELFRKMAEVSLLPDLPKTEPLLQAHKFNRLTILVSNELDTLASVYSEAIAQLDVEGTNSSVTSLYLESSNSGSYVQDAFQLLQPVLRVLLAQQLKVQEPATTQCHDY